ncbi:Hypothetical protein CINCED_3A015095 [Cinara cedri]|uniref:Uncharacterized protein n=1 Tax=Cinara cedri TaxID=506608 RepID=A0A5E4NCI8_9HEMI|nr:Hypothetical protein CINCED_3A015095 [Cinara cedri]
MTIIVIAVAIFHHPYRESDNVRGADRIACAVLFPFFHTLLQIIKTPLQFGNITLSGYVDLHVILKRHHGTAVDGHRTLLQILARITTLCAARTDRLRRSLRLDGATMIEPPPLLPPLTTIPAPSGRQELTTTTTTTTTTNTVD